MRAGVRTCVSFVPLADMLGSRMLSALHGAEEVHSILPEKEPAAAATEPARAEHGRNDEI